MRKATITIEFMAPAANNAPFKALERWLKACATTFGLRVYLCKITWHGNVNQHDSAH